MLFCLLLCKTLNIYLRLLVSISRACRRKPFINRSFTTKVMNFWNFSRTKVELQRLFEEEDWLCALLTFDSFLNGPIASWHMSISNWPNLKNSLKTHMCAKKIHQKLPRTFNHVYFYLWLPNHMCFWLD